MLIRFDEVDARTAYFWMASTITPRPVAWVSTVSKQGVANLAPFSFFQVLTHTPPTLMICPLMNNDGSLKDTARNIQDTGEFVVNLVPFELVDMMNQTSFGYEHDRSEWDEAKVPSQNSVLVKPHRVAGVPVSFECKLASFQPYPAERPSCVMVLGQVLAAHVDESILASNGQVDPDKLNLVSRMGADWYGRTQATENFELTRPAGWAR